MRALARIKKPIETSLKIPFTYDEDVLNSLPVIALKLESGWPMIDTTLTNTGLSKISEEFLMRMVESRSIERVYVCMSMGSLAMSLSNAVNQNTQLTPMVLHWPPSMRLINSQFFEFCRANRELRIERTAQGDYEVMAPTGGETSWRNSGLIAQLYNWAEQEGSGVVFDSSGGFILANGAIRSPDVSWVKKSRLAALTSEQKQCFLPLCPDFVIELRSPSDSLKTLQGKMLEYIENGASLGWLIDPEARRVYVFRPNQVIFSLDSPELLSADDELKGLKLDMKKVWDVEF